MPPAALPAVRELCQLYLEPLRTRFGPVLVISGYRTPAYNQLVGGAPASKHIYHGAHSPVAADVSCKRGRADDWYDFLAGLAPGGLGHYTSHVHVDNRRGHARW